VDAPQLAAKLPLRPPLHRARLRRQGVDEGPREVRPEARPHRLELRARRLQHRGHGARLDRVRVHAAHVRLRALGVHQRLRARRQQLLGLAVPAKQGARAHRHSVHCAAQTGAHLPPLVCKKSRWWYTGET